MGNAEKEDHDAANPLVTIAIPTYNRAQGFLSQALHSAIKQTYSNIEILVSDNCSTDETGLVVENFGDTRIRYYRQKENIGFLANVNFCLEQARGKYFSLLYDDDLIDDDFVECCIRATKNHSEVGIILTGTRVIDEKGAMQVETTNKGSGSSMEDFCLGWFGNKFPLYLCSTLFLTDGLRSVGGIRSKTHSYCDVVAEVKMIDKFKRVDIFDVKASFRRHSSNMGSTVVNVIDWCEDSLYLLELMCGFSSKKRDLVQSRGMKFFCERNFRRAGVISSPFYRMKAYIQVYIQFRFSYSLPSFLYNRNKNSMKRFVREKQARGLRLFL